VNFSAIVEGSIATLWSDYNAPDRVGIFAIFGGSRIIHSGNGRTSVLSTFVRHPMNQIGALLDDAQRDPQGFVDTAVLLPGQRVGGVGMPDLAAKPQGMCCLELGQHPSAGGTGQRRRVGDVEQAGAADGLA
jgi:hypothetical protein